MSSRAAGTGDNCWWRERELNPRRTACKAALRTDGLPVKTNVRRRGRNRTCRLPLIVRLHCRCATRPSCCTRGWIRTCTGCGLSASPLPLGYPGKSNKEKWSTAGESNASLLLGRQGPRRSDSGAHANGAVSRNCPGPSELATRCASNNTLTAYGAPGRIRTGMRRGCSSPPISSVHGSRRGDGANRTRATVVDLGLANRSVTAPARPHNHIRSQSVPTGGFEPPEPAFVVLAAFHLPWASASHARFELASPP